MIRKEPKHTCPMIDDVIDNINTALKYLCSDDVNDAINILESIESKMEDIRDNCSEIRSWGSEWKEYSEIVEKEKDEFENDCDKLKEENEDLNRELKYLQHDNEELKDEINSLEYDLRNRND